MAFDTYLRFVLALAIVLALIALCAWAARRFGLGQRLPAGRGRTARLAIVETAAVDARRRLVLVRRDDTEHLLLLGPTGETVIETGIKGARPTAGSSRSDAPVGARLGNDGAGDTP